MAQPVPDDPERVEPPGGPDVAALREAFGPELRRLGYGDGVIADRLLAVMAARGRLRPDMEPLRFRRYARRCVDAWLRHAISALALPFPVARHTRLAALATLDLAR